MKARNSHLTRRIERLERRSGVNNPMPFFAECRTDEEYRDAKERAKLHDSPYPAYFYIHPGVNTDED